MGKRAIGKTLVCLGLLAALLSQPLANAENSPSPNPDRTEQQSQAVQEPSVQSEGAVLIDARSGLMLYGRNQDRLYYPASITKIVTAIVALETSKPDEIVTVSKEARNEDGTRVYLAEGEKATMRHLLDGMLINSGNDAATAIAEHIDGSKEKFAERMNRFVREKVGVWNTNFRNPSGLPDPAQYTTAADMARIARYAMGNETFREIVSTKSEVWNGQEWQTSLVNHNKLLWNYEGANGIKNGYTTAAGNTLVASAKRGDMELIGVVLKAPSSKAAYADMTSMLDYGFAAYRMKTVAAAGQMFTVDDGQDRTQWQAEEAIEAAVPIGDSASQTPVVEADGSVYLDTPLGEQPIGQLREISSSRSEAASPKDRNEVQTLSAEASERSRSGGVLRTTVIVLAALGGCAFILFHRKQRTRP